MTFNTRWITGKTVARVDMNAAPAREAGTELYHMPVITFTDGSAIRFVGEETDFGEYGVAICYMKPPKRQRSSK